MKNGLDRTIQLSVLYTSTDKPPAGRAVIQGQPDGLIDKKARTALAVRAFCSSRA